jgi:hypothetical protein
MVCPKLKNVCSNKDIQGFIRNGNALYNMEEKTSKNKKSVEELEIDALEILEGKMNDAAINRLHKQIVSH